LATNKSKNLVTKKKLATKSPYKKEATILVPKNWLLFFVCRDEVSIKKRLTKTSNKIFCNAENLQEFFIKSEKKLIKKIFFGNLKEK